MQKGDNETNEKLTPNGYIRQQTLYRIIEPGTLFCCYTNFHIKGLNKCRFNTGVKNILSKD